MEIPVLNQLFPEEAKTAQEAKKLLVLANRILANEGVFDAYGHISIRNPESPGTFFISRILAPCFVTLEDLLCLDLKGNLVQGDPSFRSPGERFIHCAVYQARPDVHCVCHAHTHEILPFTCTDMELRSVDHQNSTFYDGLPMYSQDSPDCDLLIHTLEEAEKLAAVLGNRRGVLMRNHGVVVVGESLPRTVYSSITLRDGARTLLSLYATGRQPRYISREEGERCARIQLGKGLWRGWNYWSRRACLTYPDIEGYAE